MSTHNICFPDNIRKNIFLIFPLETLEEQTNAEHPGQQVNSEITWNANKQCLLDIPRQDQNVTDEQLETAHQKPSHQPPQTVGWSYN